MPSPATASGRRPRRIMPLTCTCSKSPEEPAPYLTAPHPLPSCRTLLYPAGPLCGQPRGPVSDGISRLGANGGVQPFLAGVGRSPEQRESLRLFRVLQ
jgi:hypothetical protein